jgi:GNAT superfamily N-acetyltransferase
MSRRCRIEVLVGEPDPVTWAAVCAVDAALYGPEAWSVCEMEMEVMLARNGYVLTLAYEGHCLIGFASAVAVSRRCLGELAEAEYETRPLTKADIYPPGSNDSWYLTSVGVLEHWRGDGLGFQLLKVCLGKIRELSRTLPEVRVVGQMYSQDGRKVFARAGAVESGADSMILTL